MLTFMWNALQRGDHVLVHTEADGTYPLREAVVAMVDARHTAHDVGVRLLVDGSPGSTITWPRRLHVHGSPLSASDRCWRCAEVEAAAATRPPARRRAPGSRSRTNQT
jgi:hypothetical protein